MNKHAQSLGRIGGKVRSKAKTLAARANAKLGGWPKGRKRTKSQIGHRKKHSRSLNSASN